MKYVKLQSAQSFGDADDGVIQAKLPLLSNYYSRVLAAYQIDLISALTAAARTALAVLGRQLPEPRRLVQE